MYRKIAAHVYIHKDLIYKYIYLYKKIGTCYNPGNEKSIKIKGVWLTSSYDATQRMSE